MISKHVTGLAGNNWKYKMKNIIIGVIIVVYS